MHLFFYHEQASSVTRCSFQYGNFDLYICFFFFLVLSVYGWTDPYGVIGLIGGILCASECGLQRYRRKDDWVSELPIHCSIIFLICVILIPGGNPNCNSCTSTCALFFSSCACDIKVIWCPSPNQEHLCSLTKPIRRILW